MNVVQITFIRLYEGNLNGEFMPYDDNNYINKANLR